MMRTALAVTVGAMVLTACSESPSGNAGNTQRIEVRSAEQERLHGLDALNLAIALKRAIYDAGQTCRRVTDAGFVTKYQNLDMWMARCEGRDWAVFAGPDGSAQVRDCKDVQAAGLPECAVKRRPEGSFDGS